MCFFIFLFKMVYLLKIYFSFMIDYLNTLKYLYVKISLLILLRNDFCLMKMIENWFILRIEFSKTL